VVVVGVVRGQIVVDTATVSVTTRTREPDEAGHGPCESAHEVMVLVVVV
jgi:hypothetical protein